MGTLTLVKGQTRPLVVDVQYTLPSGNPSPDLEPVRCRAPHPRFPDRPCGRVVLELDVSRPTAGRGICTREHEERRATLVYVTEMVAWPQEAV